MSISIEKARELLAHPPSIDTARALKEWRAQAGYSQTEAAIRLGVPVRTLQGWELGRTMPYPTLLQRAAGFSARSADRYSLVQSDFPREFAEFIDFVGAHALDKEIRKIEQRFGAGVTAAESSTRALYGDRYFFQEQCTRFTHDIPAFGLNISDPTAVRAASLIAGINRVRRALSPNGVPRFRAMVIDNLKLDRDVRQIEHEIRCSTHFILRGYKVTFADLENLGQFDLLLDTPVGPFEVECKTITQDTSAQIKAELVASMSDSFRRTVTKKPPVAESGLFTLTLKKPVASCKDLPRQLTLALQGKTPGAYHGADFSLQFSPRPEWQELLNSDRWPDLFRQIKLDSDEGEYARGIVNTGGKILALDIRAHAPSDLHKRLVRILKDAADQCSGERQSAIWLHFAGFPEEDIRALFEFSLNGNGAGLNRTVAEALHPSVSPTDRSHVQKIRFSGDRRDLTRHLAPDSNLILGPAVSHGVACYDVTNPLGRFMNMVDL
jgi:transcriptional regulator with XRE-family HTH domain